MRKIAAHYIRLLSGELPKRLHYLILTDDGAFCDCQALVQEIESVPFYNGILFCTYQKNDITPSSLLHEFRQIQAEHPDMTAFQVMDLSKLLIADITVYRQPVDVFVLDGLDLTSPKFSTNNGSCNCHIQRL